MHRFGRSADQRWRDRWGGGFVIVAVLALAGAWYLGNWLSDRWNPDTEMAADTSPSAAEATSPAPGPGAMAGSAAPGTADLAAYPKELNVYYVQAHALNTAEQAQNEVRNLATQGIPAAVLHDGKFYKVVLGAFGSKEAANQARMNAETAYKGKARLTAWLPPSVRINAQPALRPANARAMPAFERGVAALNGYLHAAAAWWDAHATGQQPAADNLSIYTGHLRSALNQLKGYEADAAVNQLIALANKALANGEQITTAAAGPATAPAAAQNPGAPMAARAGNQPLQAAMEGYVSLLDSYRNWTAPAR